MFKNLLIGSILLAVISTTPAFGSITGLRIDGSNSGNEAANDIFALGSGGGGLDGSISNISAAAFNALTPAQLAASYDFLLFNWNGTPGINADWTTRILPYLELGGGVIYDGQPTNIGDLAPGISGNTNSVSGPYTVTTSISGLTDGISGSFVNHHLEFTSWHANFTPFLEDSNGDVVGLAGEFGTQGGRMVATGPDQDYHASPGSNQFAFLINELEWVTSGTPEDGAVPEPTSLLVWSLLGTLGLATGYRRRRAA